MSVPSSSTIVVLAGPTAVGKTAYSLALAKYLKTEIVSCDSRQLFKEMTIGTAKPTIRELEEVPHHFINSKSIHEQYTAVEYANEVNVLLPKLFDKHQQLIMTGGTGLYLQAALEGLGRVPRVPFQITKGIESLLENQGIYKLQKKLKKKDPEYYNKVDIHNPRRLVRALSVIEATGKKYSDFLGHKPAKKYNAKYYVLDRPREELYSRINQRVDLMMEKGLLKEAENLITFRKHKALQTVGYQELFKYFDGDWTLDFAVEKIKQHSRNYAKRQLTWFRRKSEAIWVDVSKINSEEFIKQYCK